MANITLMIPLLFASLVGSRAFVVAPAPIRTPLRAEPVQRIREAIDFARAKRVENQQRSQEIWSARALTNDELRAILVGRGVHEALDPAVSRDLLVALLAELRLAELPQPALLPPFRVEGVTRRVDVVKRRVASRVDVDEATRRLETFAVKTREYVTALAEKYEGGAFKAILGRVRKRPKLVVPFFLNRVRDALLDLCTWAAGSRLSPRLVALLVILAAFSDYGLKASVALLLLLRLVTELLDGPVQRPAASS